MQRVLRRAGLGRKMRGGQRFRQANSPGILRLQDLRQGQCGARGLAVNLARFRHDLPCLARCGILLCGWRTYCFISQPSKGRLIIIKSDKEKLNFR